MSSLSSASSAIGYVRVSTATQADDGVSLEAQRAKIEQYCALYGLPLVGTVEDAGTSAKALDLAGMRRGNAHLDRAVDLDPTVTRRPVPAADILARERMRKLTYSVAEAAALVGYAPETLRRAIRAGQLKAAGGGKGAEYRISSVELERWWRDVKNGGELFPPTREEA